MQCNLHDFYFARSWRCFFASFLPPPMIFWNMSHVSASCSFHTCPPGYSKWHPSFRVFPRHRHFWGYDDYMLIQSAIDTLDMGEMDALYFTRNGTGLEWISSELWKSIHFIPASWSEISIEIWGWGHGVMGGDLGMILGHVFLGWVPG